MANNPFFYPDSSPAQIYGLVPQNLDNLINRYGVSMYWMRSHTCACVGTDFYNPTTGLSNPKGTPNPSCVTCSGRGTYWDNAVGPFTGLITYMDSVGAQEPGTMMNDRIGNSVYADPALTIPTTASGVWENASILDAFVEIGSDTRFNSILTVSGQTTLPYRYNVNVLGVSAYDFAASGTIVIPSGSYVVSGATVTVTSGYVANTEYVVDYTAWPVYVAYNKKGGLAHTRPFVQGLGYPKRYVLQLLDVYLRNQGGNLNGIV